MPEKNEQATQAETNSQLRGTVENKTPKPAGLLPKNTQQLVILGVAVVMVLIMWLTGGTKRATSTASAPPAARVQPPNPATVEDFKQTIQQQQAATRQPISPSNLERLRALGLAGDVPAGGAGGKNESIFRFSLPMSPLPIARVRSPNSLSAQDPRASILQARTIPSSSVKTTGMRNFARRRRSLRQSAKPDRKRRRGQRPHLRSNRNNPAPNPSDQTRTSPAPARSTRSPGRGT
jgi:hypothetical protein